MMTSSNGTFSVLLELCAGNSPVTGEFPSQRPVTRIFDVFFDMRLNKRLVKQSWRWWFETPWRSLWRHCNGRAILLSVVIFENSYWSPFYNQIAENIGGVSDASIVVGGHRCDQWMNMQKYFAIDKKCVIFPIRSVYKWLWKSACILKRIYRYLYEICVIDRINSFVASDENFRLYPWITEVNIYDIRTKYQTVFMYCDSLAL